MIVPPLPSPPLPLQRRPAPLREGARVALVAPGGAYDPAALRRGLQVLTRFGLQAVALPQPAAHGVYAASHQARAEQLQAALAGTADGTYDAIWAVRGGAGTGRLLPAVEAALVRALACRLPWVVGFSDLTALHARLQAHGCQSLHAANLTNLDDWGAQAQQQLFAALGRAPCTPVRFGLRLVGGAPPPRLGGPLVGGNLTVLASLCGTGTLPTWAGGVLVLEDVAEAPYRLDRCLAQLVQAGALRGVRAVVLGQLTRCGRAETLEALLAETLAPLGVPLWAGAPVGHEASSLPALLGATATLERSDAGVGAGDGTWRATVAT